MSNPEVWLKLNNHLNSHRAGTIKDFHLCCTFSSFVISYSSRAALSPFFVECDRVSVRMAHSPCPQMSRVSLCLTPLKHFPTSFREMLKGWQIWLLPRSLNPPPPLKVSRPPRFLGPATVMAAHGPNGLKSFHVSWTVYSSHYGP